MEWTSVENMRLNIYEYINGVDISFIRCTMKYAAGFISMIEEILYMIKYREILPINELFLIRRNRVNVVSTR